MDFQQITKVGDHLILTIALFAGTKTLWYIRVFNLTAEVELSPLRSMHKTKSLAIDAHKALIKSLIEEKPPIESPYHTSKCAICGSQMLRRTSKFGPFFGCSRWPDCIGKANANGRLSKDTIQVLDAKRKRLQATSIGIAKDALETRLDILDKEISDDWIDSIDDE